MKTIFIYLNIYLFIFILPYTGKYFNKYLNIYLFKYLLGKIKEPIGPFVIKLYFNPTIKHKIVDMVINGANGNIETSFFLLIINSEIPTIAPII